MGSTLVSADIACPFCQAREIQQLTECYGHRGEKICELWYCMKCRGYFPVNVTIELPDNPDEDEETTARRRHTRFNVQFVVQVLFGKKYTSEPVVATAINASAGGICFLFPEPIDEGEEGNLRISLPSVGRSFDVVGRVVRCRQVPDGSWGVAVSFKEVDPRYHAALERYVKTVGATPAAWN